jgi:SMC interacting uncharacterized protein involved in chromosome segregation
VGLHSTEIEYRLDMRLCAIDNQLQRQETQRQCLDQSIRHQNERTNTIENQVQNMHETKRNLTMMGQKVNSLHESMQHHTKQINEYQHSIEVVNYMKTSIMKGQKTVTNHRPRKTDDTPTITNNRSKRLPK